MHDRPPQAMPPLTRPIVAAEAEQVQILGGKAAGGDRLDIADEREYLIEQKIGVSAIVNVRWAANRSSALFP
jgi:hypothetical protein